MKPSAEQVTQMRQIISIAPTIADWKMRESYPRFKTTAFSEIVYREMSRLFPYRTDWLTRYDFEAVSTDPVQIGSAFWEADSLAGVMAFKIQANGVFFDDDWRPCLYMSRGIFTPAMQESLSLEAVHRVRAFSIFTETLAEALSLHYLTARPCNDFGRRLNRALGLRPSKFEPDLWVLPLD